MTGGSSLSETVTALASSFTGQLLLPSDADYDEARKVHNGLIEAAGAHRPLPRSGRHRRCC